MNITVHCSDTIHRVNFGAKKMRTTWCSRELGHEGEHVHARATVTIDLDDEDIAEIRAKLEATS